MQRLEFSGAVRPIYGSLGVKPLIINSNAFLWSSVYRMVHKWWSVKGDVNIMHRLYNDKI